MNPDTPGYTYGIWDGDTQPVGAAEPVGGGGFPSHTVSNTTKPISGAMFSYSSGGTRSSRRLVPTRDGSTRLRWACTIESSGVFYSYLSPPANLSSSEYDSSYSSLQPPDPSPPLLAPGGHTSEFGILNGYGAQVTGSTSTIPSIATGSQEGLPLAGLEPVGDAHSGALRWRQPIPINVTPEFLPSTMSTTQQPVNWPPFEPQLECFGQPTMCSPNDTYNYPPGPLNFAQPSMPTAYAVNLYDHDSRMSIYGGLRHSTSGGQSSLGEYTPSEGTSHSSPIHTLDGLTVQESQSRIGQTSFGSSPATTSSSPNITMDGPAPTYKHPLAHKHVKKPKNSKPSPSKVILVGKQQQKPSMRRAQVLLEGEVPTKLKGFYKNHQRGRFLLSMELCLLMTKEGPGGERVCQYCGWELRTRGPRKVAEHFAMHLDYRPLECTVCGVHVTRASNHSNKHHKFVDASTHPTEAAALSLPPSFPSPTFPITTPQV